ncbi:SAGA-associated factor 29 [Pelomyxa schiedti]|nr:SAGA-associated factor 29 [Pelomyxa schiedti]
MSATGTSWESGPESLVGSLNEVVRLWNELNGHAGAANGASAYCATHENSAEAQTALKKAFHDTVMAAFQERKAIEHSLEMLRQAQAKQTGDPSASSTSSSVPPKPKPAKRGPIRKKSKGEIDPSRLIPPDQQVAAYDQSDRAWILCSVKRWIPSKHQYEVLDADFDKHDPDSKPKTLLVDPDDVIELPEASPDYVDFPIHTEVFAVFPATTTFYRAIVHDTPLRVKKNSRKLWHYSLTFENDNDEGHTPQREVHVKYVILPPKNR